MTMGDSTLQLPTSTFDEWDDRIGWDDRIPILSVEKREKRQNWNSVIPNLDIIQTN